MTQNATGTDVETLDTHLYWGERARIRGYKAVIPSDWHGTEEELAIHNMNITRNTAAMILELLVSSDFAILDVGCGYGRVAVNLAGMGYNVIGLDFCETMLGLARQYCQEREVSFQLIQGEATRLVEPEGPFRPGQFRLVIMGAINIHIISQRLWAQALRQARKALETGGILLIFEPMMEGNPKYTNLPQGLKQRFTRIRRLEDYRQALKGMEEAACQLMTYCYEQYTFVAFRKTPPNS